MGDFDAEDREILVECFEVRGFTVEFRADHILVSRDGKTEKILNRTVMQYVEAFDPGASDEGLSREASKPDLEDERS